MLFQKFCLFFLHFHRFSSFLSHIDEHTFDNKNPISFKSVVSTSRLATKFV